MSPSRHTTPPDDGPLLVSWNDTDRTVTFVLRGNRYEYDLEDGYELKRDTIQRIYDRSKWRAFLFTLRRYQLRNDRAAAR